MTVRAAREDGVDAGQQETIRIASVPAGHVYVRHLAAFDDGDQVQRLADPAPDHPAPVAGQWWPPAMLDARWVHEHAAEFDVFHLHFGFDAITPDDLHAVVDALRSRGKPLIYTVHDLRNPHHHDRAAHDAHLDVLILRADRLVTLTPGAAAEIELGWGRRPQVLPHPHIVEFARIRRRSIRARTETFRVGIHVKSLRASMDPGAVTRALLPLTYELPGLQLVIDVHPDVAYPDGRRHDPQLMSMLNTAQAGGALEVHIHPCYTDEELWDYLESLDLSVLPYRFGTHSGWLEACHDLGTTVLAPSCGYFAEQRSCLTYRHDERGFDAASLCSAVRFAYEQRPVWAATVTERTRERATIAAAHRALYEAVLA